MLTHASASGDLLVVQRPCALRRRIVAERVERPAEIHGRRPRRGEHVVRRVEILSAGRSEREPVRRRDADRRCAANREGADGVGDVSRRRAPQLDLVVGQAPLVEHDHGVRLEANDALGG